MLLTLSRLAMINLIWNEQSNRRKNVRKHTSDSNKQRRIHCLNERQMIQKNQTKNSAPLNPTLLAPNPLKPSQKMPRQLP